MIDAKRIQVLANEKLKGTDVFLVDVKIKPINKIFVFVDSDSSVTISNCIDISRHIEFSLDRETEDFELRVSSAGLDQPLKVLRQYQKCIGREVEISTTDGEKKIGTLIKADKNGIEIISKQNKKKELKELNISIDFEDIKETKQIISFKKDKE